MLLSALGPQGPSREWQPVIRQVGMGQARASSGNPEVDAALKWAEAEGGARTTIGSTAAVWQVWARACAPPVPRACTRSMTHPSTSLHVGTSFPGATCWQQAGCGGVVVPVSGCVSDLHP